ncbi:hypothetical protein LTR53_003452 [Teratosphaeriaceae sp. CCFEE 6253]|nr:hypothetical protein LTR53_003452 [Teratosphaeriaceae sp. CCFEE 6253]
MRDGLGVRLQDPMDRSRREELPTMKALILDAEALTANLKAIARPSPAPDEIEVQVEAIGLNPVDPLYVSDPLAASGRTIGSDFAGRVISLGSTVPPSSGLRVGDQVSGFLQGACSVSDRPGAFAEYLVVPWDLLWKLPESVTVEEAAGVSLVALTAAQGIYYCLGLQAPFAYDKQRKPDEHPEWADFQSKDAPDAVNFFIYGASTSVGLFAAQLVRHSAKASGKSIKLFGAASKSRWAMLKADPYDYNLLVDYRDEDWAEQIKKLSGETGMHYFYDCISEGTSVQRCTSTLNARGRSVVVRSRPGGAWAADNLSVEPIYNAVWEGLGEEVKYKGMTVKKSPAAREFAVAFYRWLSEVNGTSLKPVPVRLMPGGLEKVVKDGFQLLGAGTMSDRDVKRDEEWMRPVSAEKLVYRIS